MNYIIKYGNSEKVYDTLEEGIIETKHLAKQGSMGLGETLDEMLIVGNEKVIDENHRQSILEYYEEYGLDGTYEENTINACIAHGVLGSWEFNSNGELI